MNSPGWSQIADERLQNWLQWARSRSSMQPDGADTEVTSSTADVVYCVTLLHRGLHCLTLGSCLPAPASFAVFEQETTALHASSRQYPLRSV